MRLRSFHLGCRNVSPVLMASKSDIKEEGGCDCLFLSYLHVESRPIHAAARHRSTTIVPRDRCSERQRSLSVASDKVVVVGACSYGGLSISIYPGYSFISNCKR